MSEILVSVWACDRCGKEAESEQLLPPGIKTLDEIPDWFLLELPDGWARDHAGKKEYCPECWEDIFDLWANGLDERFV